MLIRAPLCLLLILVSALATIPLIPQSISESSRLVPQGPIGSVPDPNGTNSAFNVTFTHFDLYTRTNTTDPVPPQGSLTWSSNFTSSTGSPILDTAFRYQLPANTGTVQELNYTLNIPQGVASDTFITFKWNGTLGIGTNATYQVYNGTSPQLIFPRASVTKNTTFAGGPPINATGGHPFSCTPTDECLSAARFIGFNLTLRFVFKSNSTGGGIDVRVANVIVASVQTSFTKATSHTMELRPSNEVEHNGILTLSYNATVTYPKPNVPGQNLTHSWRQMVATFFLPSSYTLDSITQNMTLPLYPGPVAMGQGTCTMTLCTNSTFLSLNMTRNVSITSTAEVVVRSANAVTNLQPMLGSIPTNFWMPGDTVSVMMTSHPGFNVSGSQTVNFTDPTGFTAVRGQPVSNKGGSYVYNITLPTNAMLGLWNITGAFLSGYDFGHFSHTIRVEQIVATPLTLSGTAGRDGALNVQGSLRYSNSTPARGVNATVFVVAGGFPPAPVVSVGTAPSEGLYISNITLVNGVFTQDKSLIALFKISNPTPGRAFSANITIDHLWYNATGGAHGATVMIQLQPSLGEPFLSAQDYLMDIRLTSAGVQVTVKSLTTSNSVSRTLSAGTSGVAAFRQHFGYLKVSVTSKPTTGGTTTWSLTSPPYAYVLHTPLSAPPSQLLAFSSTKPTDTNGNFSLTIPADKTLGANRLMAFVLARDVNGIVLGKDQTAIVEDSTFLTPTASIPSELTVGQSTTVTLSLKSNSTRLTVMLTVNVVVSGSGTVEIVDSETLTIGPGQTETATFTFPAPDEAGSYFLTLSSPQYGPPLISPKTVNVYLLPGSLQALIPAIIGLVAALVILGAYLIRRRPEMEVEKEEKKRPASGKPSKPAQVSSSRNP